MHPEAKIRPLRRSAPWVVIGLLFSTVPALAQGPKSAAHGAEAFVAAAGLGRYALGDAALAKARGGFATAGGISFSFGFQQTTSINGIVVQSILVPQLSGLASGIPVFVIGGKLSIGPAASAPAQGGTLGGVMVASGVGGTENSTAQVNDGPAREYTLSRADPGITVATVASGPDGNPAALIRTTLGANGVFSTIDNSLSNQVIQQATTMNINVGGLALSVAAARAADDVLRAVTEGFTLP
ncbi:MAG: hypothetical protein ACREFS_08245 [Acetobacteraceae bacterium]